MYDYLRGRVAEKALHEVTLEVAGVGFLLDVSLATSAALPAEGEVRVFVHHHVREDQHRLYGFATREERRLFRLLQRVTGIGPGVAITILSRAPVSEICRAIADSRIDVLRSLKGVGPKTAQRLVTELRDDAALMLNGLESPTSSAAAPDSREEDAVQALEVLGCPPKPAREAVRRIAAEEPGMRLEDLVRRALRQVWPG